MPSEPTPGLQTEALANAGQDLHQRAQPKMGDCNMTRTNGHNVKELNRNFPPVMLRQLAGRDDLPFCELAEIQLALDVAEQLEADVLSVFGDIATGGEPFDQWHIAVMLRRHYTARLRNLALRLQRGDPDTVANIIGDA